MYSANKSDYFNVPDDKKLICECGDELVLEVVKMAYEEIDYV
jgi:hypothetical protein